jgi:hypothetical protein
MGWFTETKSSIRKIETKSLTHKSIADYFLVYQLFCMHLCCVCRVTIGSVESKCRDWIQAVLATIQSRTFCLLFCSSHWDDQVKKYEMGPVAYTEAKRKAFWGSPSCCACFIKVIRRTVFLNNCLRCSLYLYFDHYMFRPLLAILRRNTIYKEVVTPTTDPLYIVQILLNTYLANTAVVYLNVIARYLIVNAIALFLILKC